MISGRGIAPTRRRETTDGASATSTSRPQLGFAWSLPRHQAKDTRTLQVRIGRVEDGRGSLALQLPFLKTSESMGNHDSEIVDAGSVD